MTNLFSAIKSRFGRPFFLAIALVVALGSIAAVQQGGGRLFEISKNLELFMNVFKEVNANYVDEIDPGKLMKTGIDAMLQTLDPYTNYITESQVERYRFQQDGQYYGIGTSIDLVDGYFTLIEPHKDSPAFRAGLKAGDRILAIDGKEVKGLTMESFGAFMQGAPNTAVKLTIQRANEGPTEQVEVTRSEIEIPNVPYYEMVAEGVGYINLTTFTQNAAANIGKALRELKEKNPAMKGLILDLRDNGGGLLAEAVNISNLFLPQGEDVVFTRGKVKEADQIYKTRQAPMDLQIPLVVLINGKSASASEIVSGVMQDYDRGVLIGQRSYGKGLVQNTKEVGYNSRVKVTISKYYIPSGRCIQSVEYKDGEPVQIPDSLRAVFKTRAGRKVLDGGGVAPDVPIVVAEKSAFTRFMLEKYYVFQYVNQYLKGKDLDLDPVTYKFLDYENFIDFIARKNPVFESESHKQLAKLKEVLEKDKMLAQAEAELKSLEKKMTGTLKSELEKNKHELVREIEREIVTRLHYQKGKLQYSLKEDAEVKAAVQLFNQPDKYRKLLQKA
jgi:carboxyl-terminal processing protease